MTTKRPSYLEVMDETMAVGRRIQRDADAAGLPTAWTQIAEHPNRYHRSPITAFNAGAYATVERIYQNTSTRGYGRLFKDPDITAFIYDMQKRGMEYTTTFGVYTVAYHAVAYEAHGRHHYRVSDGLALKLALTELRGLKTTDLRLPYDSIYIELPRELNFRVSNGDYDMLPAEGVFVVEDRDDSGIDVSRPTPGRSWRLLVLSETFAPPDARKDDPYVIDATQSFFTLPLLDGDTVDDAIERLRNRTMQPNQGKLPLGQKTLDTWINVWRWVMNVIVYATTPDADATHLRDNPEAEAIWRRIQKLPKVSAKRDRLQAQLKGMDPKPVVMLGKSVRLTPELRDMYESTKGEGRPLMVRVLVTGHFRRYHTKEGIVWKFIDPHWRGPEDAPVARETEHRLG